MGEKEASKAENLGIRTVLMRLGYVLAKDGGGFPYQLKQVQKGNSSYPSPGSQWLSWIHIDDVVEIMVTILNDERYHGAVNIVAPDIERAAGYAKTLAEVVGNAKVKKAPSFFIKLFMGPGAPVLLYGKKVVPKMLNDLGYPFLFPKLKDAMINLVNR